MKQCGLWLTPCHCGRQHQTPSSLLHIDQKHPAVNLMLSIDNMPHKWYSCHWSRDALDADKRPCFWCTCCVVLQEMRSCFWCTCCDVLQEMRPSFWCTCCVVLQEIRPCFWCTCVVLFCRTLIFALVSDTRVLFCRKCTLTETSTICPYHIRLGLNNEPFLNISQLARNRVSIQRSVLCWSFQQIMGQIKQLTHSGKCCVHTETANKFASSFTGREQQ